jgi:glyoxylase-like metal-dependent hydrolase (beta-lactamase superfamily II)
MQQLQPAGGYDVALLLLGHLEMDPQEALRLPEDVQGPFQTPVTALLLRRPGSVVLVDAGSGPLDHLWPGANRLPAELEAAGVTPADVTDVVLTHIDFDHAGGVVEGAAPESYRPAFPNARVVLIDDRLEDWRNPDPSWTHDGIPIVKALDEAGVLHSVSDGQEAVPGVVLRSAPGHRWGHAVVEVGGELVHLADAVHHPEHVTHPEWDTEFDSDPELALETRRRLLEEAADRGVVVTASHLDGAGVVERDVGGGLRHRAV